MAYKFYALTRTSNSSKKIVMNDCPPSMEGMYNIPRQVFKTQQMEAGAVVLEYGPDPGNQVVTLTVPAVPECILALWHAEYMDRESINEEYELSDHRGRIIRVKWKDFRADFVRTLPPDDVLHWYEYYQALPGGLESDDLDSTDPDRSDLADLYKVVMEFHVVAPAIP